VASLLLTNAHLIDPASGLDETGNVFIKHGVVEAVGKGASGNADQTIDCSGHVLAPGLIDMRVFACEPGAEHKETLATASQSAAAGGVTTIIVMPDTEPVIDEPSLVDYIERRARDTASVHVHPMGALTKGLKGEAMCEMGLLSEAGAVAFTQGRRSIMNAEVMRRLLEYATGLGVLIVHHTEDENLAASGVMNEGELSSRLGLTGSPVEAEVIMVERDIALAELTGGRLHFAQVSCARSLSAIQAAKERGVNVTCAVSAHHLALNENDIATYRTFFKTSPPLRSEVDRQAMVQGLKDGIIDVVVSSHDPQGPEDKRLPFAEAADGAIGLETLLPVLLELVHNGSLSLAQALSTVTTNPATLLGLKAGQLAVGEPADLTLIDLESPWKFNADRVKSKSQNSPFDERRFQGRVLKTVVSGKLVFELEAR
jgi:dihydroorotase